MSDQERSRSDGWAPVLRPASEVELAFARAALDAAGIPCFVHNGHFGALLVGPQIPLYNVRTVLVPESDADLAREALRGLDHRDAPVREHATECDRARVVGEALLLGWFLPGASRRARPLRALGLTLLTLVPILAALALLLAAAGLLKGCWEGQDAARREPTSPSGIVLASLGESPSTPGRQDPLTESARLLLAELDPERRSRASLPRDSGERFEWSYLPGSRAGLPLREMDAGAVRAVEVLLQAALSEGGFRKVGTIRRLEEVLFARSGWSARDPDRYYVALFGDPAEDGSWAWRFEGHHVSLHWAVEDGRVVASAPQFLGANPAEVRDGPLEGTRALAREEDLARALVRSLDERQRALAVAGRRAPRDILSGSERDVPPLERRGVPASVLSEPQRELLVELLREYASVQPQDVARERIERVETELPRIRFVWMGGLEPGEGHYYRIRGSSFLVEYDNTQDGANHVHSVWRDLSGEWGPDPIAEHYRTAPHHADLRASLRP